MGSGECLKVKAPFHGRFSWQQKFPPQIVIYAYTLCEYFFDEYHWDYQEIQRITVAVKHAVRMGEDE
jgi:hypothetical protein